MLDLGLAIFQETARGEAAQSLTDFTAIPVHQFKWLIYLSALAFHGVISVILTELMGRTYGKWWLWFTISFLLPVIGPISILMYHWILSTSVTEARQQTFWDRMLFGGPVSLRKILLKEQASAQEVKLTPYRPFTNNNTKPTNGSDPEVDRLIKQGNFGEARALAWNLMEIAREAQDGPSVNKYQDYLEVIAVKQSMESGEDISS
jgi:hypothetical protein